MSINRIGSSYNNYYGYSAMNQTRLQQSLYNRINNSSSVSKVSKVQGMGEQLKSSFNFVQSYDKSMSELMSDANKLRSANSTSVLNERTVTSSNSDVVSAQQNYRLRGSDQYSVNVEQLASAQMNQSAEMGSTELAASDADFSIITNTQNASFHVSAVDENGNQKTNKQLLQDVAKQINDNKELGVSASVVEKDGKSSLQVTAKETGEKNSFLVSGEFAEASGLTEAKNVAQDAKYTVSQNGEETKEYTSSSNKISLGYGKISATLNKTGSAQVSVGMDSSKVVSAMDDLVNSYNRSLALLNNNVDRGSGVEKQLWNMVKGPASEKSMELIGVTTNKDGTLSLDKNKLAESLKKDPSLTKDIIGGVAGIAQGSFQTARSGMSISSSNLINRDMDNVETQRMNDPIQFLSMHSSRGYYNLMNYSSVGLMMNLLV